MVAQMWQVGAFDCWETGGKERARLLQSGKWTVELLMRRGGA